MSTVAVPELDALYVVSDLHMGGVAGRQMFCAGKRFEKFVGSLTAATTGQEVGLVLNGDTVDFLAEPDPCGFDPWRAGEKLDRIVLDPAFAPVWKALRGFVGAEKHHLVLTLGNHDLELALPAVRERLLRTLSGGDAAARGRITLAFEGAGYRCRVRGRSALCVHGNDQDDWNRTDFERLRRMGRDLTHGRKIEPWMPNAGTQLVIQALNHLKRDFPFLDLIKPETKAALWVALALDPERVRSYLAPGVSAYTRAITEAVRASSGFLSAEQQLAARRAAEERAGPLPRLLAITRDEPSGEIWGGGSPDAEALYDAASAAFDAGKDPRWLAAQADPYAVLDWRSTFTKFGLALGRSSEKNLAERLRTALSSLATDQSFDHDHRDPAFELLDQEVGPEVDFLITGHTHLARARRRCQAPGDYFNSGTWMRLLRIPAALLAETAAAREDFEKLVEALKSKTLAQLDRTPPDLLQRVEPTAVVISPAAGSVHGKLVQVAADGNWAELATP